MKNYILIAEVGDFIEEKKLIAQYLQGHWEGNQWRMNDATLWEVIVTGVGALNVMQTLRNIPLDAPLINIGYAGSANYDIGSVVVVNEVRLNHPCVNYPEPILMLAPLPESYLVHPMQVLSSVCYSNTDFVLQSNYTDCVFDMELAYIAGLGFTRLSSLKIVSDNLSLHTYREVVSGIEQA